MEKNKKVYIAMSADVLHSGHLNVINEGIKYGDVIVGLLTDEVIATYKRVPLLNYEEREKIFRNIKGVTEVIKQDTLDYTKNLELIKPDYVIHGDDWKTGIQSIVRENVINTLQKWNGQLIEIPYTHGVSCSELEQKLRLINSTPDTRRGKLKIMLKLKNLIRVMEASNGLSGLIVENLKIENKEKPIIKEFDAMWVSSLCDSTFKGKPDIELVDLTSRINTINEIMEVTSKPIILDGDTGGKIEHFVYNVKTLERLGVSAIIIEDKTGLKKNSLFGTEVKQVLEDPDVFAEKIRAGKSAQATRDFMIFARLESLIAGMSVEDAMMRAIKYIEGGADGVMIHSKEKTGLDIFEFLRQFREYSKTIPVILVPTTYNQFTEQELAAKGANIIIYANHLLRSAFIAMENTAKMILENERSLEADALCAPIKRVLTLIPGGK